MIRLLKLVDKTTIFITAQPFIVRRHFVVDATDDALVQIAYLGDNFKAWFLDKTEMSNLRSTQAKREVTLCYKKLQKPSLNAPIIFDLGGEKKAEIALFEIFVLLKQQPHGRNGPLLTNGYENLFFVCDKSAVLRVVSASRYGDGWYVGARSVWDKREWRKGSRIFSHLFM